MDHTIVPLGHLLREPVSSLTHLLGAVVCLYVTALLWQLTRQDRLKQLSFAVCGGCMVVLYLASSVYHGVVGSLTTVEFFGRIDHSAVFLMIAGTLTPILVVVTRGSTRSLGLTAAWSLAVIGILMKWLLPLHPGVVTAIGYLIAGWGIFLPVVGVLIRELGWRPIAFFVSGGLVYCCGAVVYALRWPTPLPGYFGSHEIHHVAVMIGSTMHVMFLIRYVAPRRAAPMEMPTIALPALRWVSYRLLMGGAATLDGTPEPRWTALRLFS